MSPLKERGQLFSDPASKAKILLAQFKSVFTIDDGTSVPSVMNSASHTHTHRHTHTHTHTHIHTHTEADRDTDRNNPIFIHIFYFDLISFV